MAGDVEVRTQVLEARLRQLVRLFDDTDQLKTRIQTLRYNQSGGVWPEIPSVQAFAARYREALTIVEQRLESIRTAIDACRQALSDSALSLEQQDAAIQEQFRLLTERLEATPVPEALVAGAVAAGRLGRSAF